MGSARLRIIRRQVHYMFPEMVTARGLVPQITHQQTFDSDQKHHLNRKKSSKMLSVHKILRLCSGLKSLSHLQNSGVIEIKNPDSNFNQPLNAIKPNHRKIKNVKFHSQKHWQFYIIQPPKVINNQTQIKLRRIQICNRGKAEFSNIKNSQAR